MTVRSASRGVGRTRRRRDGDRTERSGCGASRRRCVESSAERARRPRARFALPAASPRPTLVAAGYLFDLNGFLVIRNAFSPEEVAKANAAIDANADKLKERKGKLRTSALYGRESHALAGDGETGRIDGGGLLGWDAPHADVFRSVLAHPSLAPGPRP